MAQSIQHTILVVEDEESLSQALGDRLTREGFVTLTAKNGKEGLEIALREHPDVTLLDIVMPVVDGLTMLEQLRKDAWGKTAKVILLTNLSDNEKIAEAMNNGVFEYLVKSNWKLEDMVKKIREQLPHL